MTATTVILEGPMGKALGREWTFQNIRSARHAISMINANTGKAFAWVRDNIKKYANYRVLLEYEDGRKVDLDTQSYAEMRQPGVKTMRFVPVISGASGAVKTVVGVVIMVVGAYFGQGWAVKLGAAIALGGVAQMLSPKPSKNKSSEESSKSSHYFNGAANLTDQGAPVQLIYGRCLAGSQAISAAMTVDQLL